MKAQGKLNRAFAAMQAAGLIAVQEFCDCQSCGLRAMTEIAEQEIEEGNSVKGYVFYHVQDSEYGKKVGDDFYLTYGKFETDEDEISAIPDTDVATLVVAICQEHGVKVEWDGNIDHRILVKWSEMLRENETEVAMVGIKMRRRKV